ncbi:MAG TPA: hypothetical protein VG649_17155 [Candidatus Angelobacter sp.]|jgi:hypothetical protein|nr:hypothetical protein [Candidatus Angelobacter sp.]
MAVIGFSGKPEHNWIVARWVYRQILEDVISHCPEDSEIADKAANSLETDGLLIEFLEPSLAARITNAVRQVVAGILSGAIRSGIHDQSYGDADRVREYRKALQELLEAIPSPKGEKSA